MKKRKDNLTDLIEELAKKPVVREGEPKPSNPQVVVNGDNEIITLANKKRSKLPLSIRKKSLELSVEELERIIDYITKKVTQDLTTALRKALKEKGF